MNVHSSYVCMLQTKYSSNSLNPIATDSYVTLYHCELIRNMYACRIKDKQNTDQLLQAGHKLANPYVCKIMHHDNNHIYSDLIQ